MKLPMFQNEDQDLQLLQNKWASILNPVLANPLNSVLILKNVKLGSGVNSVDHLLQRKLEGWFIVRKRGSADIYDIQDTNQSSHLTLKLNSSAPVSVDLAVF